ncbi:MAG: hypothetical protein DRR16_17020 [Candidatus Parabeggiatoa sp. nov. 3]|nr:MAG: hypothetical protein DRR16_17020 [Gammaproteobacteria bacterium]
MPIFPIDNNDLFKVKFIYYSVSKLNKLHLYQVGTQRAHSPKKSLSILPFLQSKINLERKEGSYKSVTITICTSFNRETLYLALCDYLTKPFDFHGRNLLNEETTARHFKLPLSNLKNWIANGLIMGSHTQKANSFSRQRFCAQNLFHAKVSRSETLA